MTYPPQQPGPYGQDPYGQQQPGYGQQPDPFAQQPAYQGFGGYPGPGGPPQPPKRDNTGKIVAIVLIALLVLGGAGVGVYFLTKGDDKPTTAAPGGSTKNTPSGSETQSPDDTSTKSTTEPPANDDGPQQVVEAYVDAYETKSFSSVTTAACDAYKKKYGTDTSDLEGKLAEFDIIATAKGSPEVKGSTATAQIDLKLSKDGQSKDASIKIKIVKESGAWKFCGEEAA
ncbi:hypothetical protein [Actinokineospora sp.]|uniref:hypothetical protein n=1 Tax=Actinokineospora sp. TaxID=1872133 RepID=UPI0040379DBD